MNFVEKLQRQWRSAEDRASKWKMLHDLECQRKPAPLTDDQLIAIYRKANGEDVGTAQPLTTKRILNAMRAARST